MKRSEASAAGYRAVTGVYELPAEGAMLNGVLADMRRGRIDHVLVKGRGGVAVWRRGARANPGAPHLALSPSEGEREFSSHVEGRGFGAMKLFNSENAHWYRRDGEPPGMCRGESAECRMGRQTPGRACL